MALSSLVPALSSTPPCTAAMLNCSGSVSSTSSSPSCIGLLTCSFSQPPHTVALMPFLRPTSLCYSRSRRSSQIVRMAPEEEKKTQRSPLDFPIEWERPKPGRRADIFPQFSPMKTPLPGRESVLRCYRREVHSMSVERALSLASGSGLDFTGIDVEGPCDANDLEKRKATAVINNILTVLVHDGESTGRLVRGKRHSQPGTGLLGASLNISLGRIKQSFVLTDANLPDMPIVFASDNFLKLTGLSKNEVLGYNCRSFSEKETDSSSQFRIKECIQNEQPCTLRMLNYRKDGTSFRLHISPVRNASGKVAYFVAVEGEDNNETKENQGLRQRGVVAAVKVAVRGLSMSVRTC